MISAPGERNNGGVDLPSANSQRDQNLIKKLKNENFDEHCLAKVIKHVRNN